MKHGIKKGEISITFPRLQLEEENHISVHIKRGLKETYFSFKLLSHLSLFQK